MIIYEVVGYTARIDWADTSKRITLGFYKTKEGAERHIDEMRQDIECYMKWDMLTYQPHTVKD